MGNSCGTSKLIEGAASDAKLANAKLSLATGGAVTGVARFQGTVA